MHFSRIPRLIRWIFTVVFIFIVTMTVFRFLFYLRYNPVSKPFSGSAFLMGLRYDAKFASILGISILALCAIPFLNPFKRKSALFFWNAVLPLIFILTTIVYISDYYHFDYLGQRLNASVLNYLEDATISFGMVMESYPVLLISIVIVVLSVCGWYLFSRLLNRYLKEDAKPIRRNWLHYVLFFLLLGCLIFGKISQFNLRWSDAFTLSDDFKANLALNPFQSFFSTLKFKNSHYDIRRVKHYYPLMADYLGVNKPDSGRLVFERLHVPADTLIHTPNIVLIICESFSAYKSSKFGNPLKTTPYFDELASNGILFERCFTPSYGTARGVWATITGIPDVESPRTASRNPGAVDQYTIINNFKEYQPYYFLGGNTTWANIQGLLANNIQGLRIYQQEDFKAEKIDVWGISDKNLFLEANEILSQSTKPFFAIIQTADNHRPYTIPEEDRAAVGILNTTKDSLKQFGFESNAEYNAFRYTDYCYKQFIEAAKKETFFKNTIFVFVGDHGIRGNATRMFPKSWTDQGLTAEHVPLLFYSPEYLRPAVHREVCSQIDVLPTIAGIAKIPYRNNAMGRNLMEAQPIDSSAQEKCAFIYDPDMSMIGIVTNKYYYTRNLKSGKEGLVSIINNDPITASPGVDSIKSSLRSMVEGYFETARYLLLNNKKKN